jgi:N-acetylmuramoyl-L-alanine amidase
MRIGRVAWGGPEKAFGTVMGKLAPSVTVHHSRAPHIPAGALRATEEAAMRAIHRYHTQTNGWAGIGYNFCITQNGNVYEARGWGRVGAHAGTTEGNQTSVGVCFLINGEKEAPTAAALAAFQALREEGVRLGWLTSQHRVKLHRDWKQTDCPGEMVASAMQLLPAPVRETIPVLRRGSRGHAVRELQRMLVDHGVLTRAEIGRSEGIFGPKTEAAVREFQRRARITVDGIAGPETMEALG